MTKNRIISFSVLALLSAAALSVGFLVPHSGGFALIAFVPLLWMDHLATLKGVRHFFPWYYLTFLLWNLFTTFWVCNATFWGGVAAIAVNALLMSAVWALFRLSRKRFKGALPYIFLVTAWIAWERFFFRAEISWPWLTLSNAFASTTTCVQWYEVTGLLGGSLWIWLCNLTVFGLSRCLSDGRWAKFTKAAKAFCITGAAVLFIALPTVSIIRYATLAEDAGGGTLKACALQPNFDPYQKFESMSQSEQNAVLSSQIMSVCSEADTLEPLLLVAPEAFTNDITLNDIMHSPTIRTLKGCLTGRPNTNMIFGGATYELFFQDEAPSYTARRIREGQWYEDHNSALMIDETPRIELYHKSCLVIGTEKLPWPRLMSKVENLLGITLGHCIGQPGVSLLNFVNNEPRLPETAGPTDIVRSDDAALEDVDLSLAQCASTDIVRSDDAELEDVDLSLVQCASTDIVRSDDAALDAASRNKIPLGCAVCYESIYSEYFAGYVEAGAEAMAVITNDAWWGNTPGYRQHLRYSCLRAIETRRDIVRSANTGISAFINQRGDIVSRTDWWKRQTLSGELNLSDHVTPFVKWGDVVGRLCTFVFLLLIFALGINLIARKP